MNFKLIYNINGIYGGPINMSFPPETVYKTIVSFFSTPHIQEQFGYPIPVGTLRLLNLMSKNWINETDYEINTDDVIFLVDENSMVDTLDTDAIIRYGNFLFESLLKIKESDEETQAKDVKLQGPKVQEENADKITLTLAKVDKLLALAACNKNKGTMVVRPNPYLLHQTSFDIVPKRIFVVLSWNLREMVYPYLKEILESKGYTTTYAGDREGQVVFNDIWLLLNEAEAVLVDFTERRPNVYLEYGMALVLGKPIIAITQNREDIPSDTPNLKYLLYSDNLKGFDDLRKRLPISVSATIEDIQKLNN